MSLPLIRCCVAALAATFVSAAPAQSEMSLGAPAGAPFFLLSDAAYGSNDNALVRLEAQDLSAVAEYGGADVYVYRVAKPLEFLQRQKNLHRVDVAANYSGSGMSNALARVWDSWWTQSRAKWRALFSQEARQAVTAQAPEAKAHPLHAAPTPQTMNPQYKPLAGHELVASFRYPVERARPIEPPAGVQLAGSSSEFIRPSSGNVMIPLGQRAPGLYLVEAMVGAHRAVTLVFVSDSIAVTKVSAQQMLVWVASRRDGKPLAGAKTVWTDGVGVLKSGTTNNEGLAIFERAAPEKTYVYGEDSAGGVFIAENFYYDSEIYGTKLYAVTDRPLYRPGDQVFVKFLGRAFRSARESTPVAAGALQLQVFDPSGFPIAAQTVQMTPGSGADTSLRLPENAAAGGYELRFVYQGDAYGAAFRVADYQKPHFEINVLPAKRDFKTNEAVTGRVQLTYPDGKPVVAATAELQVRAQRLTMIEGDLGYTGQFPVKLATATLTTDARGFAAFELPAATEPSRYVLTVLATDGAAYRVRTTRELLIERASGTYQLKAERAFSAANENVMFALRAAPAADSQPVPATWEWVRLDDRARSAGALTRADVAAGRLAITFPKPGTYTVSLRDAAGNIVGAASHHVSGAGVGAPQGSIDIVLDKTQYQPGEVAQALVTFPQAVDEALLTLERDRVEKTALMTAGARWARPLRIAPAQWRIDVPVGADYGPNITFSVVYVKDGEYVFQNHGIKVAQPRIEVAVKADQAVYAPGDTVNLALSGQIAGKAAAGAQLTVSVVDEMIYVLQPEIAPDVFDFFYHPRRNNVRTSASLNFIGYDLARPPSKAAVPSRRQTHERAIKVLERPRREDVDTALWQPRVVLDADGSARVSFKMPDSLTRWRVTVRAVDGAGTVGQSTAYVRSDKEFYVKWTSPNWLRTTDAPTAAVAIFNQGASIATAELTARGAGLQRTEKLSLKPGANFVALPLRAPVQDGVRRDDTVELRLSAAGKPVDALSVSLKVLPVFWSSPRSAVVPLNAQSAPLKLPPDATHVRVQMADSAAAHFRRVLDDLIEYPYGCVEQTASRLLPYTLALQSLLPGDERLAEPLTQQLNSHRLRLAQMAGPKATFGWWSVPEPTGGDALLTAYAYYADWYASRALKIEMPAGHWDRLLEVYRTQGAQRSRWHRALMLSWMQEMGLPVTSLAGALADELARDSSAPKVALAARSMMVSSVLAQDEGDVSDALTRVLTAYVVRKSGGTVPSALQASLATASERLRTTALPLGNALLLLTSSAIDADAARRATQVLEQIRNEAPTIDRALALLWVYRALSDGTNAKTLRASGTQPALGAPWQAQTSATGQRVYRWPAGTALPTALALSATPAANQVAVVQYDSREPEKSGLAVTVQRRLYRLRKLSASTPQAEQALRRGQAMPDLAGTATEFELELLDAKAPLKTDELYLDEVVLTRTQGAPLRFGIVEVPLPPGASAERGTWGVLMRLPNGDTLPIERARFEPTPSGYAVPVEHLRDETVVRHLVRVAQPGNYALPPVRYYRMYQPEQKAFESNARGRIEIR